MNNAPQFVKRARRGQPGASSPIRGKERHGMGVPQRLGADGGSDLNIINGLIFEKTSCGWRMKRTLGSGFRRRRGSYAVPARHSQRVIG